jgi:hypothetical protein
MQIETKTGQASIKAKFVGNLPCRRKSYVRILLAQGYNSPIFACVLEGSPYCFYMNLLKVNQVEF